MSMFCFQCQETAGGKGCTRVGVCGKQPETANLQDLLIYSLKGMVAFSTQARANEMLDDETDYLILDALFATITNANFDSEAIKNRIEKVLAKRDQIKAKLIDSGKLSDEPLHESATFNISRSDMTAFATPDKIGVLSTVNEDVRSLRELVIYGLKGMAAYGEHAMNLGMVDTKIMAFFEKALLATLDDSLTVDQLVALVLETGQYGVEVMALLDNANTAAYGNPEITEVNIGVRNNPAILISGHDLKDMEELLKQTEGTGVDVYTHSEMLPANYYPAFKKYEHFVGNYGNAWWQQKKEFESFNGPVLFTTNCIVPPKSSYQDRIYTTGAAGYPGFKHIPNRKSGGSKDFSEIIEHAKKLPPPTEIERGTIVGGFAHNQVMALADKVIEAVKTGAIKQFFVMAGCDGRVKARSYYTEFAEQLPKDTIILTAGCAKYRYNKLKLGDINGIPRVLDAGQCNDSYSLAVIALKLKEAFGLDDVNDLPLSYNIAWYEQKAVIVLLALLYLGFKNIKLGPTLPGFLSPNVAKVLVEKFGLSSINQPAEDIKTFLNH